jgi:hypothetical protein
MSRTPVRRSMMVTGALVVLAAACTHPGHGGPHPGGTGTVTGRVTRSPTGPGPQREGQVCVAPVAGIGVRATGVSGVKTTRTDAAGVFRLTFVVTGPVTLTVDVGDTGLRCPPVEVAVKATETVTRDIDCDTGIR